MTLIHLSCKISLISVATNTISELPQAWKESKDHRVADGYQAESISANASVSETTFKHRKSAALSTALQRSLSAAVAKIFDSVDSYLREHTGIRFDEIADSRVAHGEYDEMKNGARSSTFAKVWESLLGLFESSIVGQSRKRVKGPYAESYMHMGIAGIMWTMDISALSIDSSRHVYEYRVDEPMTRMAITHALMRLSDSSRRVFGTRPISVMTLALCPLSIRQ